MININWSKIPTSPGVYLWKDKQGEVIYVGKAKNLRSRMKQYFSKDLPPKNKLLIKVIDSFDFQVSNSEVDALILEETLINKYEPKYNIKIKNSKRYPYIMMSTKNGLKLSVSKTFRISKDSKYFGPYPDGYNARKIINFLSMVIPIDKCLNPKQGKPCLNYQMNRCMGDCIDQNNENKITYYKNMIKDFFKGKQEQVISTIKKRIDENSANLNFERAKELSESLDFILKVNEQTISKFKDSIHRDVINYYVQDTTISISIMHIRFGSIQLTTNYMFTMFNPDPKNFIEKFIIDFYKSNMIPEEIIVPFNPDWNYGKDINLNMYSSGFKKELLDLTNKHASEKYKSEIDSFNQKSKLYENVKELLGNITGNRNINTIEMIDISSLQGSSQVGAVIRYVNGLPDKNYYRRFNIKSIDNMNDYAAIREVLERHFTRMIKDNIKKPDLFIVDGKYQLNILKEVASQFKETNNITLIGLIKNSKHKTASIISNKLEITKFKQGDRTLNFFEQIQEEVHRFAISFHKSVRSRKLMTSELDKFKFLTNEDKNNLFLEFGTIRSILNAKEGDLLRVLTKTKTSKLISQISNKK